MFAAVGAILVVMALIGGLITLRMRAVEKREKPLLENEFSQIMAKNDTINKNALKTLKEQNFICSHTCYLTDYITVNTAEESKKQMFCVDLENKKIALINYEKGGAIIVNFSDLINYEVFDESDTIKGDPFPLVICKELKLILRFKDYNKPQAEYVLISTAIYKNYKALSGIINKSEATYNSINNDLQQTISYLEMILNENKKG